MSTTGKYTWTTNSVVGIDFGFQNSLIASPRILGADVIWNGSSKLYPTMVRFDQRSRKVGEQALAGQLSQYKTTIKNMKQLIGLAFNDPRAQREMKFVHFKCVPLKHALGGPDSIGVELDSNGEKTIIPIEVVAGMMIEHLCMIAAKNTAEITDNNTQDIQQFFPRNLVVAIPSYYTDAQRRALLHGCNFVGIRGIKKLIHENTAVALEYGLYKDYRNQFEEGMQTNVMFIDMGASCYTVTIAAFETGKLTIKSAHYDTDLGGRNFDLVIANWLSNKLNGVSDHPHDDPKVMFKFLAAAERAKKTLSQKGVKEAFINMEHLTENWDFHIMLKASDYEKMCAPLIARLEGPIKKTLEEAKLTSKDLASVEIVGGGSRIGFVREKIQEILDISSLSTTLDVDEAVARGAAYQAAILSPRFKMKLYEIVDFYPLPVVASFNEEKTASINDNGKDSNDCEVNDIDNNVDNNYVNEAITNNNVNNNDANDNVNSVSNNDVNDNVVNEVNDNIVNSVSNNDVNDNVVNEVYDNNVNSVSNNDVNDNSVSNNDVNDNVVNEVYDNNVNSVSNNDVSNNVVNEVYDNNVNSVSNNDVSNNVVNEVYDNNVNSVSNNGVNDNVVNEVNDKNVNVNNNDVNDKDNDINDHDGNDNESSKLECVLVTRGMNFPILRRITSMQEGEFKVTLRYNKSDSECDGGLKEEYFEEIGSWIIKIPSTTEESKVMVTFMVDFHGIFLLRSARVAEEKVETKEVSDDENLKIAAFRPLDWSKEEIEKFCKAHGRMANEQDHSIVPETPDDDADGGNNDMKSIWTNLFPALFKKVSTTTL